MQANETHSFSLRCALESVALEEGVVLPRVYTADVRRGAVAAKIAYVPTPDGGVFHLVDSAKDASTP